MADAVIENPILKSPYDPPTRHWRFDDDGITDEVVPPLQRLLRPDPGCSVVVPCCDKGSSEVVMGALEGVDVTEVAALCRRFGIAELSVFGSAARGDDGPDSDVDLLYVSAPDASLGLEIVDLHEALEALLGRPVDLVPKEGLHWVVRDRVLAEARPLYAA